MGDKKGNKINNISLISIQIYYAYLTHKFKYFGYNIFLHAQEKYLIYFDLHK
jgi:hypothetical protein